MCPALDRTCVATREEEESPAPCSLTILEPPLFLGMDDSPNKPLILKKGLGYQFFITCI